MKEGIGVNAGIEDRSNFNVPLKGASKTVSMTWRQVRAILGDKSEVVIDFEDLPAPLARLALLGDVSPRARSLLETGI